MPETYTLEEMRALEDLQALEAAIARLAQTGESPLILSRMRRIQAELAGKNKDLIKRYNEEQKAE